MLFEKLSEVRKLTTFYIAKNDHRWVIFIWRAPNIGLNSWRKKLTSQSRSRSALASASAEPVAGCGKMFRRVVLGCIEAASCKYSVNTKYAFDSIRKAARASSAVHPPRTCLREPWLLANVFFSMHVSMRRCIFSLRQRIFFEICELRNYFC